MILIKYALQKVKKLCSFPRAHFKVPLTPKIFFHINFHSYPDYFGQNVFWFERVQHLMEKSRDKIFFAKVIWQVMKLYLRETILGDIVTLTSTWRQWLQKLMIKLVPKT